jgi:hypothetical protein
MSETVAEIEAAFVGVNDGVAVISACRIGKPTLICGTGRNGTTALSRCFLNSDGVDFVAEDLSDGSNLETTAMNLATKNHDREAWATFREQHSSDFVCKQPRFEHFASEDSDFASVWNDANIIVMTRDPLNMALRQWSINGANLEKTLEEHVVSCFSVARKSVIEAQSLMKNCGVVFVSYEKLITIPQRVADALNEWFSEERLTKKAMAQSIMPNNPYYLERQTLGWMRQMKDMQERRKRGER